MGCRDIQFLSRQSLQVISRLRVEHVEQRIVGETGDAVLDVLHVVDCVAFWEHEVGLQRSRVGFCEGAAPGFMKRSRDKGISICNDNLMILRQLRPTRENSDLAQALLNRGLWQAGDHPVRWPRNLRDRIDRVDSFGIEEFDRACGSRSVDRLFGLCNLLEVVVTERRVRRVRS